MFVCLFGQRFLSNPRADYFACGRSLGLDVSSPLLGVSDPRGGQKEGNDMGWSHSCIGQLPFLFLSAMPNVVEYVGHRPAHILM